jgi:hypothetical protein
VDTVGGRRVPIQAGQLQQRPGCHFQRMPDSGQLAHQLGQVFAV